MGSVDLDLVYINERGGPESDSLYKFIIMNSSPWSADAILLVECEGDFVYRVKFVNDVGYDLVLEDRTRRLRELELLPLMEYRHVQMI